MTEATRTNSVIVTNHIVCDTPPAKLGKFLVSKGALASLEECTIRFTPPSKLNDEWDCIPFGYRCGDIEKAWHLSPVSRLFPEQKKYFIDKYTYRDWGSLREQLSDNIGVASFVDLSNCDLPWMWDRYGDCHKGCLIIFATTQMGMEKFYKVRYSEQRPEISIPLGEEPYSRDEVLTVLTTKELGTDDHWENESEWRMFAHLSQLSRKETMVGTIFVKSYPRAFVKVICGHNMDQETFKKIEEKATCKGVLVEHELGMLDG